MADLTLPYPGYNWQLTQHMGMVDSASLSALLEAADLFKGAPDFFSVRFFVYGKSEYVFRKHPIRLWAFGYMA